MAITNTPFTPGQVAPYDQESYSVSQGNSTGRSNYIPEIFSTKMLMDFYASTVFGEIANTDYEGEIKKSGDKVHIRVVPTMTVNDYLIGGYTAGIDYEVPQDDARFLVIDQAKYWAFKMDYIDEAQTDLPLVNKFAENAALQMKIGVDTEILDFITTAGKAHADNIGNTAGAISGDIRMGVDDATPANQIQLNATTGDAENILNVIVDMNAVLDENNIPPEGRWVVLPAWACALLKKGELQRADVTGDSTGLIRTGLIGTVDGMKIYKSNNIAAGANLGNFLVPFGTNEALTFAAQITKTESLPIQNSFGTYWRGLFVYGREVVQPKALGLAVVRKA